MKLERLPSIKTSLRRSNPAHGHRNTRRFRPGTSKSSKAQSRQTSTASIYETPRTKCTNRWAAIIHSMAMRCCIRSAFKAALHPIAIASSARVASRLSKLRVNHCGRHPVRGHVKAPGYGARRPEGQRQHRRCRPHGKTISTFYIAVKPTRSILRRSGSSAWREAIDSVSALQIDDARRLCSSTARNRAVHALRRH